MSLTYLSGDENETAIGKRRGGGGGGSRRGGGSPRKKLTKEEKKEKRKRVFKKVAKVGIAPARAAFLTIIRLNALKTATKLARVWNKPNGKETLIDFWAKFGGKPEKLKEMILKGTKNKTALNADEIGSATAIAATLAAATPILVALVPIIKRFKAGGEKEEAEDFDKGINDGKQTLENDSSVEKTTASMPQDKEVGYSTKPNGEANNDPKIKDDKTEEDLKKDAKDAATKMGSIYSPLGLYFMVLMYINFYQLNNIFIQLLSSFCIIGIILIPFADLKNSFGKVAKFISYSPINFFNQLIQIKWERKKSL